MKHGVDYIIDEWEPEPFTDEELDELIRQHELEEPEEPEPLTETELAELEARVDGPDGYCEELQYVRRTHTSKDEAVTNKATACKSYGWSSHRFFFDELSRLHSEGLTVRHLPPQPGKPWETRFLFLDIDNDAQLDHQSPNVTGDELSDVLPSLGYPATFFCPSTSRKPYKWHIIVFLDVPARTSKEYNDARDNADSKLRDAIARCRKVKALPRLTDPKVQWQSSFYGPYCETVTDVVLKDWVCNDAGIPAVYKDDVPHAERTMQNPVPRLRENRAEDLFFDRLTPRSSSEFCRWLRRHDLAQVERIDDMEFDFKVHTPWLRRGAFKSTSKFPEGSRHVSISAFGFALYNEARACNLWLHEHGLDEHRFSDSDVLTTFEHYTRGSFEFPASFDLDKELRDLEVHAKKFASFTDRDYLEQSDVAKFSTGRYRFRTRNYTRETAQKILKQFGGSSGVARFDSVEFREAFLVDQRVSFSTLRKTALKSGVNIVTARKCSGGARPGAGRKPKVSWETLGVKGSLFDGVFRYVTPVTSSERKWLARQNVKVKKLKKR